MTLMLDLSPELEQYLLQSAEQKGLSVEEVTLKILSDCMQNPEQNLILDRSKCEVWSPYDSFSAAETMLRALKQSQVSGR
jgi:hypothetical protein